MMYIKKYNQYIKENAYTSVEDELDIYLQALKDEECEVIFRYSVLCSKAHKVPEQVGREDLAAIIKEKDGRIVGYSIFLRPDEPVPGYPLQIKKHSTHYNTILDIVNKILEHLKDIGFEASMRENMNDDMLSYIVIVTKINSNDKEV